MLSYVELRASLSYDVPLWASPQFTMSSYAIHDNDNVSDHQHHHHHGHGKGGGGMSILSSMRSSSIPIVNNNAHIDNPFHDAINDPHYLYYEVYRS
jgi:hypothetical protein